MAICLVICLNQTDLLSDYDLVDQLALLMDCLLDLSMDLLLVKWLDYLLVI